MSNNNFRSSWYHKIDALAIAFVFIAVGFLLILRNVGIVSYSTYHILVSWQMLFILIGLVQLVKHKLVAGAVLMTIGLYFIFPRIPWWPGHAIVTFWPVVFIFTGVVILISRFNGSRSSGKSFSRKQMKNVSYTQDGFVTSEVAFGSAQHIVFDPFFKGGKISNSFGSTVIDLRRTHLEDPDTIIELDCAFGSVEVYAPVTWNIILELDTVLSGYHDKRYRGSKDIIDNEHKLIIRGNLSFSSLDIKG